MNKRLTLLAIKDLHSRERSDSDTNGRNYSNITKFRLKYHIKTTAASTPGVASIVSSSGCFFTLFQIYDRTYQKTQRCVRAASEWASNVFSPKAKKDESPSGAHTASISFLVTHNAVFVACVRACIKTSYFVKIVCIIVKIVSDYLTIV